MKPRRARGFSLIEVIVAMTIIATVFTVVFRGISLSLDTLRRVEESDRRLELVRSKLAEIDLCPTIRAGDHAEGTFADGTHWTADTSNFIPPSGSNQSSVVRIDLKVTWRGRNSDQQREIATYRYVPFAGNVSLEEQLRELR